MPCPPDQSLQSAFAFDVTDKWLPNIRNCENWICVQCPAGRRMPNLFGINLRRPISSNNNSLRQTHEISFRSAFWCVARPTPFYRRRKLNNCSLECQRYRNLQKKVRIKIWPGVRGCPDKDAFHMYRMKAMLRALLFSFCHNFNRTFFGRRCSETSETVHLQRTSHWIPHVKNKFYMLRSLSWNMSEKPCVEFCRNQSNDWCLDGFPLSLHDSFQYELTRTGERKKESATSHNHFVFGIMYLLYRVKWEQ